MHEPGEEDEAEAGEAAARVPSDPLRLLVITANREQHSFTLAAPESKTVGDFKNDLEGAAWIKHDQQLLFLLSKDVHLLWDDSTPMSELLGPSTSPRVRRGPVRVLLARDFLGVMAYRASLPAWYEDHYKLMLHMFAPDPGKDSTQQSLFALPRNSVHRCDSGSQSCLRKRSTLASSSAS
jgi:hypothetical protein